MIALQGARGWREWLDGKIGRKGDKTYRVRILVQTVFALTCVLLGIQFKRFVSAAKAGELPLPHRTPGVEGFLPISGLMGLVDWFYQGTLNTIHPAATIIFGTVVTLSILLRKSFCSWVCPIGFLSETLARLGRRLFGRTFRIWRFLDIPLRGLKYLLLAFFAWAIFNMSADSLNAFIESAYNRLSDVKRGLFFVNMIGVGLNVLLILTVSSMLVKGFWCRYLCPYGALLGLFSWMSPAKIRRDPVSCIDLRALRQGLHGAPAGLHEALDPQPGVHRLHGLRGGLPDQGRAQRPGGAPALERSPVRGRGAPPLPRQLCRSPRIRSLGEPDERRGVHPAHPAGRLRALRPPGGLTGLQRGAVGV